VDDGSSQPTRDLLRAAQDRGRTRVIWLEHRGNPSAARNAGIRNARGDYIAFIDSDDLWQPRKLERQLEELARCPHCRWCYTAFTRVDSSGTVLPEEATRAWVPWREQVFLALIDGGASVRTPSVLAERSLLIDAGGFDESLRSCEDYDLWMRLAQMSSVALVDEPLVRVRLNDGSHSNRSAQLFFDRDRSLAKIAAGAPREAQGSLRRARALNSLSAAERIAREHGAAAAARHLAASMRFAWRQPRWWAHGGRLLLRAGR
jgi:glycosyltransferase involved in cell wall biosynthesis